MKCKNCGGDLLVRDGKCICQSCGTIIMPDKVYEAIDVFLCYIENDATGRRTHDSFVAQEVYHKLTESKISAFYERISADGLAEETLVLSRYAAIHNAKVILVLGTCAENFAVIEKEYRAHFSGKPIIPFCVNVKPGEIPKTLSKIQAVNYATIGWDKDLVNSLYHLLGREKELDTGTLYMKHRRKKLVVFGIVTVLLAILSVIIAWLTGILGDKDNSASSTDITTTTGIYSPSQQKPLDQLPAIDTISENAETSLTQQEIFDQALTGLKIVLHTVNSQPWGINWKK